MCATSYEMRVSYRIATRAAQTHPPQADRGKRWSFQLVHNVTVSLKHATCWCINDLMNNTCLIVVVALIDVRRHTSLRSPHCSREHWLWLFYIGPLSNFNYHLPAGQLLGCTHCIHTKIPSHRGLASVLLSCMFLLLALWTFVHLV